VVDIKVMIFEDAKIGIFWLQNVTSPPTPLHRRGESC